MLAIWLISGLILAFPALANGQPPTWIDHPPASDSKFIYAVGEAQGATRANAEKAALADAQAKLAAEVAVTVTARTISTLSTRDADNGTLSETRSSARGLVRDSEPVGKPWIETVRRGFWPLRRKPFFTAKVLLRWPRASLERERKRQASVWKDYRDAVDRLAQGVIASVTRAGLPGAVVVGGFVEAVTQRPYALSQILKRDLSDSLVRAGIGEVPADRAKVAVSGAYRVVANEIVVTARVVRLDSGERVGVADVAFDRATIEPAWLEDISPIEPFFESLEPERADIRTRIGAISVTSKPDGAQVFVDGVPHGRTPTAFGAISVGERSVMVLADGREPFIEKVRVLEGETLAVEAALPPKRGDLEVRSMPAGAEVFHHGKQVGLTPLKLKDLPVGRYELTLTLDGHENGKVVAEVRYKDRVVSQTLLLEKPGSIFVVSDPPGATIFLDGVNVGKASSPRFLKLDHVAAGPHQISASKTGTGVWAGPVTVHALRTETVTAMLQNNIGMLSLSIEPMVDLIQVRGEHSSLEITSGSINCETGFPCTPRVPLEAGVYRIGTFSSGYESEERVVRIRAGREAKMSLTLAAGDSSIKNGPAGHIFGKLMPGMKETVVNNWNHQDDPGASVLATAILSPLLAVVLAVDVIGLPFRLASLPLRSGPVRTTYPLRTNEESGSKTPLDPAATSATLARKEVVNMSVDDLRQYLDRGKSR